MESKLEQLRGLRVQFIKESRDTIDWAVAEIERLQTDNKHLRAERGRGIDNDFANLARLRNEENERLQRCLTFVRTALTAGDDRFGEHSGHVLHALAVKRSGLFPFWCVTCDRFVAINHADSTKPVVHKVADKCPGCGGEIQRWEVCEPELCEVCREKEKDQQV